VESWVLERLQEFVGRNDRVALEPRVQQGLTFQSMAGQSSYRVTGNLPSLGRGLVVTEEGVVPDYARVRRVFHLTNAITKYYYSPFYLEAQVPGYHARVAWLGGRPVGFTRDGRYCAFTTDRAPDFIPLSFFEQNPRLVVCLTIEGRGIPYAKPSYRGEVEDVVAWGTDLLEQGVREPLEAARRYELFVQHGIRGTDYAGPFEAADRDAILAWMKEQEASGAGGIVLKPSERHHRPLKYALPSALRHAAPAWLALDQKIDEDPCLGRLLQAACAATEVGVPPGGWDWEAIGRALLDEIAEAVRTVGEGGTLIRQHSVWLHAREAAAALIEQLQDGTTGAAIRELELVEEKGGWRLRFERRFDEATAALQRRLSGASYRD
jgi:putative ATP-dependent DNA ligase